MSRLSKMTNDFFYAWGDNDPKKEVLRNGKMITLERLHEYDDHRYYKPRRETAGAIFISGAICLGALGVKMIVDKSNQK